MTSITSETLFRAAVIAGLAAAAGPVLDIVLRRTGHADLAEDLRRLRWPVWALAGVLLLRIAVDAVPRAEAWSGPFFTAAVIAGGAWLVTRALLVGQDALFRHLHIEDPDNARARSRRTQVDLVRRVVSVAVVVGTAFVLLVSVSPIRSLGTSLLAYASLVGVVLCLALRQPAGTVTAAEDWGQPAERKQVRPSLEGSVERLFHEVGRSASCSGSGLRRTQPRCSARPGSNGRSA
jgi:erythromycin esterase